MREINTHKVNGCNEQLHIQVIDEPGSGGASHRYSVRPDRGLTTTDPVGSSQRARACCDINFQNGPINEHGVNGITQEVLLAICKDRLECFQAGPYASPDNQEALEHINAAIEALHRRTKARVARGVEGTSTI